MGYRVFRDAIGTEWQAWDVSPRILERRVIERRTRIQARPEGERRMQQTRRILASDRHALTNGLQGGWLCFEAPEEKRRLTPIPGDWQRCPQEQLEQYCAEAVPARRTSQETPLI